MRRWYRHYRDRVPPTHPQLRTKHFEKKLTSVTQLMVQSCERSCSQAENLLAQSDANMRAIRDAIKSCDLHLEAAEIDWELVSEKAREQLTSDCSVCLCPLLTCQLQPHPLQLPSSQPHPLQLPSSQPQHPSSQPQPLLQQSKPSPHWQKPRPLSVLSCGHVLHEVCIEALEKFTNATNLHLCPLCRAPYQRIPYHDG